MSQGVAAARKRRAPASLQAPVPPQISTQQQQSAPAVGLTLPQVIALVDKRLTIVETFMNETKSSGLSNNVISTNTENLETSPLLEELTNRCELLAEEVINLKNIVLNLQSYTMEVNKTLMEERVRILSDVVEEVSEK
jgi:hypothetical protein